MGRYLTALLGIAIAALLMLPLATNLALGGPAPTPPPPGATHPHRTLSPSEQLHASSGPFITVDKAISIAATVGAGPSTPLSAEFLSVAQATTDLGFRAATYFVGDDRQVFLVKVSGPYKPAFWFAGTPPTFDHYYVVVDATTGQILATGQLKRSPK